MKNTNVQTVQNTKRKLAIVVTTLATGLFALMSNSSIALAAELVKAEPIKQVSLYQEAQESLALSFTHLIINQSVNDNTTKNMMAIQQNSVNKHTVTTFTKINLVSE